MVQNLERVYTAADLLTLPEDDLNRYELSHGRLIIMPSPNRYHNHLTIYLIGMLFVYLQKNPIGELGGPDAAYILFRDMESGEETVRIPDVSFVRNERRMKEPARIFDGPPDLAVEVVSPSETYRTIRLKLKDYFEGGTRLVWVVRSDDGLVEVYTGLDIVHTLTDADTLDGADVLPGFSLSIRDLFDYPEAP